MKYGIVISEWHASNGVLNQRNCFSKESVHEKYIVCVRYMQRQARRKFNVVLIPIYRYDMYTMIYYQSRLESEEFGQQLMIEDIFQKHLLLEQDITVHGDRMKAIEEQSEEFTSLDEDKGTLLLQ